MPSALPDKILELVNLLQWLGQNGKTWQIFKNFMFIILTDRKDIFAYNNQLDVQNYLSRCHPADLVLICLVWLRPSDLPLHRRIFGNILIVIYWPCINTTWVKEHFLDYVSIQHYPMNILWTMFWSDIIHRTFK